MTNSRIILLPSKDAYDKTSRKFVQAMNLIGWCDDGNVYIEKNRFNGVLGWCTLESWNKLSEQTKTLFASQASFDYETLTREELIRMVIRLQDENERLRKQNSDMGWRLNPDRMGGQFTEEEKNRSGWL